MDQRPAPLPLVDPSAEDDCNYIEHIEAQVTCRQRCKLPSASVQAAGVSLAWSWWVSSHLEAPDIFLDILGPPFLLICLETPPLEKEVWVTHVEEVRLTGKYGM